MYQTKILSNMTKKSTAISILFSILLWALLACAVMFVFSGCITEGKATRYMKDHPKVAAGICADLFPVTPSYSEGQLILISGESDSSEIKRVLDSLRSAKPIVKYKDTCSQIFDIAYADGYNDGVDVGFNEGRRSVKPQVYKKVDTLRLPDSALNKKLQYQLADSTQKLADTRASLKVANDQIHEFKEDKKKLLVIAGWFLLALAGKWWFWIIIVLTILYLTRKLWKPFLMSK
jgi:hypothetical protein